MIINVLAWLPDWLAVKALDALAAGEDIPEVAAAWGIVALVLGAVTLTWMVVSSRERRRAERDKDPVPLPPSRTDQPALFEAVAVRDRSQARRRPSPHVGRSVAHRRPSVDPNATTQVIDLSAQTVPIPAVYGGALDSRYQGRRRSR